MAINNDTVSFCDENKNLDVSVVGEINGLEIVEETSDSEDGPKQSSNAVAAITRPAAPSVFGTVTVSNSENVQFGNNTYFQGPVIIKQIIHNKSGIENVSYDKADDDNVQTAPENKKDPDIDIDSDSFGLKKWHKVTISIVVFFVVMSCGLVIGLRKGEDGADDELASEQGDLLIAPNHLRIVPRMEWLAQPPTGPLDKLRLPAPWVVISHTATDFCYNQSSCVYNVRLVQEFHIGSRGWYDIGYNFLVGGDGAAYYGRGWDYMGAHTLGYNKYSIGIAFIGTFTKEVPPQKQLDACKKLINVGVANGKIAKDYKLFAHSQLTSWDSPGKKLVEILQEWPHYVKDTSQLDTLLPDY